MAGRWSEFGLERSLGSEVCCFFCSKLLPLKSTSSMKDWCFGGIRKTNRDPRARFFVVDICSHRWLDRVAILCCFKGETGSLRLHSGENLVWRVVILFQQRWRWAELWKLKVVCSSLLAVQFPCLMKWFTSRQLCKSSNVLSKFLSISHPILAEKRGKWRHDLSSRDLPAGLDSQKPLPKAEKVDFIDTFNRNPGIIGLRAFNKKNIRNLAADKTSPFLMQKCHLIDESSNSSSPDFYPEFLIENFPTFFCNLQTLTFWRSVSRHATPGFPCCQKRQAFFESADAPIALVKCGLWQLQREGADEKKSKKPSEGWWQVTEVSGFFAVAEVFFSCFKYLNANFSPWLDVLPCQ